jgi:hypothetical protein
VAPVRPTTRAGSTGAHRAVFLLEAYVAPAATEGDPVGEILAAIRAEPDVEVLGTVVIPDDEAMLCLIEAPSEAAAEAVVTRVGRDAIRLVEARWLPARSG